MESVEFKHRIKHTVEIIEEVNWQDVDPDMLTRLVSVEIIYLKDEFYRYWNNFSLKLKNYYIIIYAKSKKLSKAVSTLPQVSA